MFFAKQILGLPPASPSPVPPNPHVCHSPITLCAMPYALCLIHSTFLPISQSPHPLYSAFPIPPSTPPHLLLLLFSPPSHLHIFPTSFFPPSSPSPLIPSFAPSLRGVGPYGPYGPEATPPSFPHLPIPLSGSSSFPFNIDKLAKSPKFRHACEGRHPELFENTGFPPSRE